MEVYYFIHVYEYFLTFDAMQEQCSLQPNLLSPLLSLAYKHHLQPDQEVGRCMWVGRPCPPHLCMHFCAFT
jgi:hypothetical protein